jgi:hypothetical protein
MASTDRVLLSIIRSLLYDTLPKVELIIHHRFPGVELVSPLYYSDGVCYLSPDQKVDAGSTMQAGFNADFFQSESVGILMYKLQKQNTDQSNGETISTKEASCTQLVVIWKVNSSKEFFIASFIIEHDERHIWDRDRLKRMANYYKKINIQHGPIEYTWLMRDNTALMTRENVTLEEKCYKLEITISEGSIDEDTWRPWYFYLDR